MIPWLETGTPFPDVSLALDDAEGAPGLLAAGADLSAERLLLAYRQGIFPWYSEGQPILWWSPDPRMVLRTDRFLISHSLKKTLKRIDRNFGGMQKIRFDGDFERVIRECAARRKNGNGTWISEEIIAGYTELHRLGYAHSAELWDEEKLIGAVYGVCIGRMFYGESMFARETDASKIALAYLVHFLKANGVEMIDCQQQTAHLASLGASAIPRQDFIKKLREAVDQPQIQVWKPLQLFQNSLHQ